MSALAGAFAAVVILAPLVFAAAVVADLALAPHKWRHTRLAAFAAAALGIELCGVVAAGALWLRYGMGMRLRSDASLAAHHRLQKWYSTSLLSAARVTCGLRIAIEDPTPAAGGNAIVIGRHTSIGDAMIPAVLLTEHFDLRTRYVLKDDLLWSPAFDVVGQRLGFHFVNRSGRSGEGGELAALRALARGIDTRSAAVIFPEGTFFTPARRERAIARLRESSRPELAGRAERLRYLLAPRPGGTLALLEGAPHADVVVIGNIGLEQFTSLKAIYRSVPLREPVQVWLWRVPNAEIPRDADRQLDWLYDQWERLDASIQVRMAERESRARAR